MDEVQLKHNRSINENVIMLLGIGLTVLTFCMGRWIGFFAEHMGWNDDFIRPVVRAVLSLLFIVFLGGKKWLRFEPQAIRDAWIAMRPLVLINIILAGLLFLGSIIAVATGTPMVPGVIGRLVYNTILMLIVGINEEGMFRGLMFGGLLAKLGNRKNGVLWAAIISSFCFGFLHVAFDLDFSNPLGVTQGMLKTLETAMFGLILCMTVLDSGNLWGAMLIHALFDWLVLTPQILVSSGDNPTSYVSTDSMQAIGGIVIFSVLVILYFHRTRQAVLHMRDLQPPQLGPFMGDAKTAPVERFYAEIKADPVTKRAGRKKMWSRMFDGKVRGLIWALALNLVLDNVLGIFAAALTQGDTQLRQGGLALAGVLAAALLYLWYCFSYRDSFEGAHDWSQTGMLLATPALLFVLLNLLDLRTATQINSPLLCLIIACAPGFSEEVFSRVIPLSNWMRLDGKKDQIIPAVLTTSAVFGGMHSLNLIGGAPLGATIFQVFYAAALGIFFGAVTMRSGSMWPTVIMHTLIDTVAFLGMDLANGGLISEELTIGFEFWLCIIMCAILVVVGLYLIRPAKQDEIVALWDRKWHRKKFARHRA